jgi:polysaccharide export outer membrane protein
MFKVRTYLPLLLSCILFSCAAPRKTIYFRTDAAVDPSVEVQQGNQEYESVIQSDDILAINITSISSMSDKDPVGIFRDGGTAYNMTAGTGTSGGPQNAGYLVDKEGFIDFPVVGKISVAKQTIRQAKSTIAARLKDYMKDPVVEVRIINYKVIVLGEVGRPGTIIAPNHKINIIEAIAAAGDIPVTGRKDNVLIIRENNGNREFTRLNLNSRDIFKSPYYYLKQNDIISVEASQVRRQESNAFTRVYLPVVTALVSTALSIYGIILISRNNN